MPLFTLIISPQQLMLGVLGFDCVLTIPLTEFTGTALESRMPSNLNLPLHYVEVGELHHQTFFKSRISRPWNGLAPGCTFLNDQKVTCNEPPAKSIFRDVCNKPIWGTTHKNRDRH